MSAPKSYIRQSGPSLMSAQRRQGLGESFRDAGPLLGHAGPCWAPAGPLLAYARSFADCSGGLFHAQHERVAAARANHAAQPQRPPARFDPESG